MKKLIVPLILFISGCSQLPISTEFQSSLISSVGDSLLKSNTTPRYEISEQPIKDKKIRSYVKGLGAKLFKASSLKDAELYFYVLSSPVIQGMAAYNDSEIYVTSGMLNTINNEAELAALLGHEIGHIALGHIDSEFSDQGEIIDKITDKTEDHFGLNLRLSAHRFDISFSQFKKEKEERADEFGATLAMKAGYNPYALCDLFDRLSANVKGGMIQTIGNLKGSHKSLSERAEHLRKFLAQKGYAKTTDGFFPYRYQHALASLLVDPRQTSVSNEEEKILLEVANYQREVERYSKLKQRLPADRFITIMGRVSSIARKYQISKSIFQSSSENYSSFMQEKLIQKSPIWGGFKPRLSSELVSLLGSLARVGVSFIPVVGSAIDLYELLSGIDFISGEKLSPTQRAMTALGLVVGQGRVLRGIASKIVRTSHQLGVEKEVKEAVRQSEKLIESAKFKRVKTPYGDATQELSKEAILARSEVEQGKRLYRIGTRGRSQTGKEAQFWSLEHPQTPGYGEKYGVPKENLKKADFIETGVVKKDSAFVTRTAPPAGGNPGGGTEVVVTEGGVKIESHTSL